MLGHDVNFVIFLPHYSAYSAATNRIECEKLKTEASNMTSAFNLLFRRYPMNGVFIAKRKIPHSFGIIHKKSICSYSIAEGILGKFSNCPKSSFHKRLLWTSHVLDDDAKENVEHANKYTHFGYDKVLEDEKVEKGISFSRSY